MKKINCERLDDFGRGIGYIDGKVVFVSGMFPGEEGLVNISLNKKKYMIGELFSLEKKAVDRICPKCSYNNCGCALKSLNYEKTLIYKKDKVKTILKKFGGIDINIKEIVPSLNIYNYRNKITLKVKSGKLGYFKNNSNELIEIDECIIADERINKIISILKKENLSKVLEIIIKAMDEVMIIIKGNMNFECLKEYADSIYMDGNLVYGKDKILNSILDFKFLVSRDSFFQVNKNITEKLYKKVLEYALKGDRVIDLYCGTGTISLLLSKHFKEVIGIEINKEAVECANRNKEINCINNVTFMCGDANKITDSLKASVVTIDPARAGMSEDGIKNILKIKPDRIVYVSCNPVTLARDLKFLKEYYNIIEITLYDMFPWTYHVECVTLLTLK